MELCVYEDVWVGGVIPVVVRKCQLILVPVLPVGVLFRWD